MDQRGGDRQKPFFRFLPASRCRVERLASVYDAAAREGQACRIQALLANESGGRCFFVVAGYQGRVVALLQLCRDQKRAHRFRIRGLYSHQQFRRQGLATRLLQLGAKCVFELYHGEEILSFVPPTNIPSITAHKRAGFCPAVRQTGQPQPEHHLCLIVKRKRAMTVRQV